MPEIMYTLIPSPEFWSESDSASFLCGVWGCERTRWTAGAATEGQGEGRRSAAPVYAALKMIRWPLSVFAYEIEKNDISWERRGKLVGL